MHALLRAVLPPTLLALSLALPAPCLAAEVATNASPGSASTKGGHHTQLTAEQREALRKKMKGRPKPKPAAKANGIPEKPAAATSDMMAEYAKLTASLGATDIEDKEIFYYQCKNVSSATLKRVLENFITSSGTVANSDESDVVVVSDLKENIGKLRDIAQRIDCRVPQVLVEAQIVELTLDTDFEKELKLDFEHTGSNELSFIKSLVTELTTPGAQPTTGEGLSGTIRPYVKNYPVSSSANTKRSELGVFLRYLETKGKAKILSAPNLILRRGSEGSIVTGQDVPIQEKTVTSGGTNISTIFRRVGIKLKVKPLMVSDDTVRMTVTPEVSAVTGYSGENPIIALRNATTELEVKDGELISIGGLLRSEKRSVRKRVPIASSIPLIGHFFRATRIESVKTHLVIFLTITILQEGIPHGVVIHRPRDIPTHVRREIDATEESEAKERPRAQILEDLNYFLHETED